jgi:hypothetical protein
MLKEFIEITYLHKESLILLDNFNILNVNVEKNNCDILISKENNIIINTQFKCNLCNKEYKSYQSLWNHGKIKSKILFCHQHFIKIIFDYFNNES